MENSILIGVYEESGELIGYKADSFWTLSKTYGKPDRLVDGKIRESLINNLRSTLKTSGPTIIGILEGITKEQHFGRFETRLIGFELDGKRTFTHRIFESDVQELDAEDLAEIGVRTNPPTDYPMRMV